MALDTRGRYYQRLLQLLSYFKLDDLRFRPQDVNDYLRRAESITVILHNHDKIHIDLSDDETFSVTFEDQLGGGQISTGVHAGEDALNELTIKFFGTDRRVRQVNIAHIAFEGIARGANRNILFERTAQGFVRDIEVEQTDEDTTRPYKDFDDKDLEGQIEMMARSIQNYQQTIDELVRQKNPNNQDQIQELQDIIEENHKILAGFFAEQDVRMQNRAAPMPNFGDEDDEFEIAREETDRVPTAMRLPPMPAATAGATAAAASPWLPPLPSATAHVPFRPMAAPPPMPAAAAAAAMPTPRARTLPTPPLNTFDAVFADLKKQHERASALLDQLLSNPNAANSDREIEQLITQISSLQNRIHSHEQIRERERIRAEYKPKLPDPALSRTLRLNRDIRQQAFEFSLDNISRQNRANLQEDLRLLRQLDPRNPQQPQINHLISAATERMLGMIKSPPLVDTIPNRNLFVKMIGFFSGNLNKYNRREDGEEVNRDQFFTDTRDLFGYPLFIGLLDSTLRVMNQPGPQNRSEERIVNQILIDLFSHDLDIYVKQQADDYKLVQEQLFNAAIIEEAEITTREREAEAARRQTIRPAAAAGAAAMARAAAASASAHKPAPAAATAYMPHPYTPRNPAATAAAAASSAAPQANGREHGGRGFMGWASNRLNEGLSALKPASSPTRSRQQKQEDEEKRKKDEKEKDKQDKKR